jgi:hypothetical protein
MGSRRTLVVIATALTVLTGTTTAAGAVPGNVVASWRMNESPGARTMIDSSGNRLHGRIGREIVTGVRLGPDTAYRFNRLQPDTPPTHPQHLAMVPDAGALDPGTWDFAITVRLRTTGKFGNIVQKGQATVSGGSFKLQIPNGIVQCLFRGSANSIQVTASRRINDGVWHTVRCARTGTSVMLAVDGATVARRSGWTGRIANSWPVVIGGKTDCDQITVGCDYYAGDLDYVEFSTR